VRIPLVGWIVFILLALLAYATRAILLPFVAGLGVAYLLDPLADKLEEHKFPRWAAAATILSIFFALVTLLLIGVWPLVKSQIISIAHNFPAYVQSVMPMIDDLLGSLRTNMGIAVDTNAESLIAAVMGEATDQIGLIIRQFVGQGLAFFNVITLLIISPVVAFFLLRDWDLIVAKVDHWIPQEKSAGTRILFTKIDAALAGFVRGQTLVAITMATLYSIGWTMAGLNYGLILGIIAGVLAYVPFVGALFAGFLAILVAIGQFGGDYSSILAVASVYLVVQLLEAVVLTPRFIGTRVGLHPVWVLFAIFAGGELMGLVGILIALPVAAASGVLVRYGIDIYLDSALHKGVGDQPR
jgi:predicted PurR-regulated permease PerM